MKLLALGLSLVLAACVQVKERGADSLHVKLDTNSGLLATSTGRVDSSATSVTPKRPPLVGADSATMIRGLGSAEITQALRNDTAVAMVVADTLPAVRVTPPSVRAIPAPVIDAGVGELDQLRRAMQVPVAGIAPSALRDGYDEMRGGTRQHEALDIPAARGTPVLSATSGRVLKLFDSKAGGLMVYASDSTEHFILMYAHLDAYQPGLAAGQPLRRGQPLGTVGTTGNAPPNVPHLHFAVARSTNVAQWWKGVPVNPYPLLKP